MATRKETHIFCKGDVCQLDEIYAVSGLGVREEWWCFLGDDDGDADAVEISRNITITIEISTED